MLKRFSMLILVLVGVSLIGCSSKAKTLLDLQSMIEEEFSEITSVEVSSVEEDSLLNKDGYYVEKITYSDADGKVLINTERFDNSIDQVNRQEYLLEMKSIIRESILVTNSEITGGIDNIATLESVFINTVIEERIETFGSILIRTEKGVGDKYQKYFKDNFSPDNYSFANKNEGKSYDVAESIEKNSSNVDASIVALMDEFYGLTMNEGNTQTQINEIFRSQNDDTAVKYQKLIDNIQFGTSSYFEHKFLMDESYENLREYVDSQTFSEEKAMEIIEMTDYSNYNEQIKKLEREKDAEKLAEFKTKALDTVVQKIEDQAEEANYDILKRDESFGALVKVYGKVVQVGNGFVRMNISQSKYGSWTDDIYVVTSAKITNNDRIWEGDFITVYGEVSFPKTYKQLWVRQERFPRLKSFIL